ncbi:endospore germination permease [Cohnella sp. AR92]|uniref:GerAB/ArcD/ProY family transporter n=1 Tax=Cohnella sp. AR92 TaxID=648716 RepID=UPI00131598B0|nr:endospore germination permease [Cohnella sp. AR92]
MPKPQFTFLQIAFIVLLSIGLNNHVIIIPILLDVSHRDAWLSVLVAAFLFIPFFYMIASIIQRTGTDRPFLSWVGQRYGKWLSILIGAIGAIVLFMTAYITGKDMVIWINESFLPQTPMIVVTFSFIGVCYYLASSGIRTIAYSSAILLPLVVLFGEFVMTFNFPRKDYTALFPAFEYGAMPMWKGVFYIGASFLELIFLFLLQHYFARPLRKRNVIILGFLLAGLTIGPVMGALAEFGPTEGALLRFPAFEEWRIVKIGSYIEHVDFLSIFQWLSGAFIRIGLALFLISDMTGKSKKWVLPSISGLLAVSISIKLPDNVFLYFLRTYYFPIAFCCLMAILLLLFVLIRISTRKGGRHTNAS